MGESPQNFVSSPGKPRFGGLKSFDYGAILLAAAVTVLSGVLVYGGGAGEYRVRVQGAGGSWVFPRGSGEILSVPGPLGDTVVEIRDGGARILSSPCVNQTCMAGGRIHAPGQWLVCLPNRVFVYGEGGAAPGNGEPDALAW